MRCLSVILALISFSASVPAVADTISYGNVGSVAPASTLTASTTGNILGYFLGQNAADTSVIRMLDITSGYTSAFVFNNHSTAAGTMADFGSVTAGDILVFELYNFDTGATLATDAAHSDGGVNHGFTAAFGGGTLNGVAGVPSGTFVGMEDLVNGDFDYDDTTFLFTNVGTTPITGHAPEPGTLVLLGTGLLGAAGLIGRRLHAR